MQVHWRLSDSNKIDQQLPAHPATMPDTLFCQALKISVPLDAGRQGPSEIMRKKIAAYEAVLLMRVSQD